MALPDPWAGDTLKEFEEIAAAAARLTRHDDLAAALERGDVDVVLARHELRSRTMASMTLFEEPRVAAVARSSSLAARESIEWAELAEYPLVVNTVSGNTRPGLWKSGQRPQQIVECANYDEWIMLVSAGRGVGTTPLSATVTYAHAGVAFVPLTGAPAVPLVLAWDPLRAGRLVTSFIEAATTASGPRQHDDRRNARDQG